MKLYRVHVISVSTNSLSPYTPKPQTIYCVRAQTQREAEQLVVSFLQDVFSNVKVEAKRLFHKGPTEVLF